MQSHTLQGCVSAAVVVVLAILGGGAIHSRADDGQGEPASRPVLGPGGPVVRVAWTGPSLIGFAPEGPWMVVHAAEIEGPSRLGADASLHAAGRSLADGGLSFEHKDMLPIGVTIMDGMAWNRNATAVRVFIMNEQTLKEYDLGPNEAVLFGSIDNIEDFPFATHVRACRCNCVNSSGQIVQTVVFACDCDCSSQLGVECLNSGGQTIGITQGCVTVIIPAP